MATKEKRKGLALEVRTFSGKDGSAYLVFKSLGGSFHAFKEVEAKEAACQCGAAIKGNTRRMWEQLWKNERSR